MGKFESFIRNNREMLRKIYLVGSLLILTLVLFTTSCFLTAQIRWDLAESQLLPIRKVYILEDGNTN